MSTYIAQSITITPKKVYYVGYDNNVFPQVPVDETRENTQEELETLAACLIGYCIKPLQPFWMRVQDRLQKTYRYSQVQYDKKARKQSAQMIKDLYNERIRANYEALKQAHPELELILL